MEILTHIFIQRASQRLLQQAACPSTRRKALKSQHLASPQFACQAKWGQLLGANGKTPIFFFVIRVGDKKVGHMLKLHVRMLGPDLSALLKDIV